jgi:hypothetical protein
VFLLVEGLIVQLWVLEVKKRGSGGRVQPVTS